MNWSRVRWFLIVCLCLADLLLGFLLWRNDRGVNTVSRAAIEDAAALLAETDVRLDADTVPTAVVREHVFRIPVSDAAYRTAYSAMVGSTVAGAYLLPASTGVSLLFENGDTVEYYHNLYLLYVRDGADRDRYEALLENLSADGAAFVPTDAALAETDTQAAYDFLLGLTPSGASGESTGVRLRPRLTAFYTAADDEGLHLAVYREEIVYRSAARSAADIYDTIGAYFGYAIAYYAEFYDIKHVLIMGRVTSGEGGVIILNRANEVLENEFPELYKKCKLHIPDEKSRRVGQSVAAASLPEIK